MHFLRIIGLTLLYLAVISVIFVQMAYILPRAFLVPAWAFHRHHARYINAARVGMLRVDVENALGEPDVVYRPGDSIEPGRYGRVPVTPIEDHVIVYQQDGKLSAYRVYVYINQEGIVHSVVFTRT